MLGKKIKNVYLKIYFRYTIVRTSSTGNSVLRDLTLNWLSLTSWVQGISYLVILTVIRNKHVANERSSRIISNKTLFL